MLVFVEGGKLENPEKNPRSKARTNNKKSFTAIGLSVRESPGKKLSTNANVMKILIS